MVVVHVVVVAVVVVLVIVVVIVYLQSNLAMARVEGPGRTGWGA